MVQRLGSFFLEFIDVTNIQEIIFTLNGPFYPADFCCKAKFGNQQNPKCGPDHLSEYYFDVQKFVLTEKKSVQLEVICWCGRTINPFPVRLKLNVIEGWSLDSLN